MTTFADRSFLALGQFSGRLSSFVEQVKATTPDPPKLPRKLLTDILGITERARAGVDAITRSLTLIDQTSLDIVDMQVRLQGETTRLASALGELGDTVERQHFVREAFGDALVALDESAQLVAAAVFPSAVKGLREVNVKLWDFEKIQWKRYTDILTDAVQRGRITPPQQVVIQSIADDVARAFADVNTLLNDLAESRASDAAALRTRLQQAPVKLTKALEKADARLQQSAAAFDGFAPVIKASRKIATEVAKLLQKLTVPIFPAHDRLGTCCDYIDRPLYESLGGVQLFALLNILARLQHATAAGRPLLEGRRLRIDTVFPDRFYGEIDRSLIDDLAADPHFQPAPASLHRFKEGSFKQRTFAKGNLQICFASRPNNRVVIDADIDLYRAALPHLFGEVLVNRLTGGTTDQYNVRRILDSQSVSPVGGFLLLNV